LTKPLRGFTGVFFESITLYGETITNNGISTSPCLDRHSQDITLTLLVLLSTGRKDTAKEWLQKLFKNVDYAYSVKKYVPIASDSLDDLIQEGGWLGEQATIA